jgi:hypothetical protein
LKDPIVVERIILKRTLKIELESFARKWASVGGLLST